MSFTVTLHDFPDLPDSIRHTAEARYKAALEKALRDDVLIAMRAYQAISDGPNEYVKPADVELAKCWEKAADLARQAGFRGLGDADEAYFDVKAER